jgi:hypothetical protein
MSGYRSRLNPFAIVTPAQAGVQEANPRRHWIPACADMTPTANFAWPFQQHPVAGTPRR